MSLAFVSSLQDIPTKMTISAPKRAVEGDAFRVRGRLRRADNNRALGDQEIDLYYDGYYIDSKITDKRGRFEFYIVIYEYGVYVLTGRFEG
ncbi:hypothetical protein ES703_112611 [subsurface metagenome]